MSRELSDLVWASCLEGNMKFVALAIADAANEHGQCYHAISTLARKCGIGDRTVQYCIHELVIKGILRKMFRKGHSNVYALQPHQLPTPAESAPLPPQILHPTPANSAPHPSRICTPPPQILHPTPAEFAPITVINPNNVNVLSYLLKVGVKEQTAKDWIDVLKDKKITVTRTFLDGIFRDIAAGNLSPEQGITICCEKGWAKFNIAWLKEKPKERQVYTGSKAWLNY